MITAARLIGIFLAVSSVGVVGAADPEDELLPATMMAGGSNSESIGQDRPGAVLGLFLVGREDSYLANVPRRIETVPDPHSSDQDSKIRRIKLLGEDKPFIALYGQHGLEERQIETVLYRYRPVTLNAAVTLKLGRKSYTFHFEKRPPVLHKRQLPPGVVWDTDLEPKYKFFVRVGDSKQQLGDAYCNGSDGYNVIWAGDLNADGNLDFIVGRWNEKGSGGWTLYVSGGAKAAPLVRPIAEENFDCGC